MDAKDFAANVESFPFGLDAKKVAAELRRIADGIDASGPGRSMVLNGVRVEHGATADDPWAKTSLTVTIVEKVGG